MKCEACDHPNVDGARFCAKCGAQLPVEKVEGAHPLIGQLIGGRFRVTGVLGEGGMGIVFVGEQQMGSSARKVAIKTLHAHLSHDPSVLARFHRECGTVAQLEHPNTIKFYDFGATADGTLYIAMEFVKGRSLADVVQDGPLSPERVTKIMRQVCGALDEAHMQGIIHRDLKPDNVVLTNRAGETDFVKVLDFGIAARTESADANKEEKLTQQGMVLGTPPYMSPEQFTGKQLDARSDIYSLAVMAYELLTGKLPFEADTPWQWATQHMTAQPIPFEVSAPSTNIPETMRVAIFRALSKDREQRPSSARDFFAELSDGGRMTVEQAAEPGRTGTASMDQVPSFASAQPVPAPHQAYGPPPHVSPTPMSMARAPGAPPARGSGSGSGKGLVVGLGAVGAVLVAAIAVIAIRSSKSDEDVGPILAAPAATVAPGPLEVKPAATPEVTPTAMPTTATEPAAPNTPTKPVSTSTPKPNPNPASGGAATATPPKGDGCEACIAAANSGNAAGAAAAFNRCSDAGKKAECKSALSRSGRGAVSTMAKNGNCSAATAMVSAAQSIGVDLSRGLNGSSCK